MHSFKKVSTLITSVYLHLFVCVCMLLNAVDVMWKETAASLCDSCQRVSTPILYTSVCAAQCNCHKYHEQNSKHDTRMLSTSISVAVEIFFIAYTVRVVLMFYSMYLEYTALMSPNVW